MRNVMISNGLRGKNDPKQYVADVRKAVRQDLELRGESETCNLINTFFADFNGNRLQFLGKTISDGLAIADIVYFMDDWHNYDGCCVEHLIAVRYGLEIRYLKS